MTDLSTFSGFKIKVDLFLARLTLADEMLLEAVRICAYEVLESTLTRKQTLKTVYKSVEKFDKQFLSYLEGSGEIDMDYRPFNTRVDEALRESQQLISVMDSAKIGVYLSECRQLGLEEATRRCRERNKRRQKATLVYGPRPAREM